MSTTLYRQDRQASVDLLCLHEQNPQRYPFLLQSALHDDQHRYDILFAFPGQRLELHGNHRLQFKGDIIGGDFLAYLGAWWRREKVQAPEQALGLPFWGGWFFFLGYEVAGQIEPTLPLAYDDRLPIAAAVRIPATLIFDRQCCSLTAIAEQPAMLDTMLADLDAAPRIEKTNRQRILLLEEPPQRYLQSVQRIKAYILAGDVFQVNLSRLWEGRSERAINSCQLYRQLRESNPAPYAGIAAFGGTTIVSSSPERLVRVRGSVVETRPIAGTRPRGGSSSRDRALADELLLHPKEIAEHIMLIDLERNDLGRICRPGSVQVNEMMALETYAHVHHIVSNVRGELRDDAAPDTVLRAVFPGGTITGCPKVRTMEIIDELEKGPRGAYTGSLGYLNRDGSLDSNILIRSIVCHGNDLWLRTGAGIVADSEPDKELAETRAKAKGLRLAL